jgi:hypothetical protein
MFHPGGTVNAGTEAGFGVVIFWEWVNVRVAFRGGETKYAKMV